MNDSANSNEKVAENIFAAYSREKLNREALLWCANTLTAEAKAKLILKTEEDLLSSCTSSNYLSSLQAELASISPNLILTDWPDAEGGDSWLRFAAGENLALTFLRWHDFTKIKRVLILSSGGVHVMRQLWVAQLTAASYGCPVQVLQIVRKNTAEISHAEDDAEATRIRAKMLGIELPVKLSYADDVITGIKEHIREDDLLVMGAPSHWRLAGLYEYSLPDRIAKTFSNPLMMLLGKRSHGVRLRDVFWPHMINLNLSSDSAEEAIARLIDCMIANYQAPPEWREKLLAQALEREEVCTTAVGSSTAFPHIMIPIHGGMAGCLGVFPQGVDYSADGQKSQFIFLFITPDYYFSDYLDVLSLISEKIISNEIREKLLQAKSSQEILDILDPL